MHHRRSHRHKSPLAAPAWFALGLAVFLLKTGAVKAGDDAIELLPHWNAGQKLRYEMTQTRNKSRGGTKLLDETVHSQVSIEVLDAGKAGYRIGWTAAPTTGTGETGMRLVLRVSTRGNFEAVENWKEIQAEASRRLDRDAEAWKKDGLDDAAIQRRRENITAQIGTKEQIEDRYADDARLFFMALGRRYPLAQPVPFRGSIPDPMGSSTPLPCHGEWLLKSIGKDGVAAIRWRESVAAEATRRAIEEASRTLAARMGGATPGFQLKSLTIDENADFNIEVRSGWVQSLTHTRTVKTSTNTKDETRQAILAFVRKPATP